MPFVTSEVYAGMPEEDLNLIMYGIVAEHEEDLLMQYDLGLEPNETIEYMADVYEIAYGEK